MTHKQEDIDAAEAYSNSENNGFYKRIANHHFLAGIKHKQKEIDDYWNDTNKSDSKVKAICETQRESHQLIQKHAK